MSYYDEGRAAYLARLSTAATPFYGRNVKRDSPGARDWDRGYIEAKFDESFRRAARRVSERRMGSKQ